MNKNFNKFKIKNDSEMESFLINNFPDIDLYKCKDGTIFGGKYRQDSLELRGDHLFIFRNNNSLYYKDINKKEDIINFINNNL